MVPLALIGLVLAILTGAFMKISAGLFGRLKDRVVLRALVAGAIFSVVGVFAPVVMFSGETQVQTVIEGAAGYGIALLLVMAIGKLALLARRLQERVPRRADVPAHLRLDQRGARPQPRLPGRAGGDLRRRHHDRRRLRAVPDPADGGPAHGVHARRRPDDGGAHRAGHRHRDDRHAAAATAHGHAAGAQSAAAESTSAAQSDSAALEPLEVGGVRADAAAAACVAGAASGAAGWAATCRSYQR